jgi:hypothetical protein
MRNIFVSFLSGACGGAVTWILLEFVQKPFRGFFDLKRQAAETFFGYRNVSARAEQVRSAERRSRSLSAEEEKRLQDAEMALRGYGAKFIAFAKTEKAVLVPLRLFGYEPAKIGDNFVGLSNSIGEYGSHRNYYSENLEKSLHLK